MEYADPKRTPPDPGRAQWLLAFATFTWQAFVGIIVPVGVGVLAAYTMSPILGGVFGMLTAILIFITAKSTQLARRRRALIVLSHVDTALRMNMPLSSTLRRWREAETPGVASLLTKLADRLESGAWLSDSMCRAQIDLPARVFDRLAAAERAGRLSVTIGEILEHERRRTSRDPSHAPFLRVYSIMLLIAIPGVATIISIFVMPKFQQIMKDFGLPMPAVMRLMIAMTQSIAPIFAALGIVLFILASQVAIGQISSASPPRWAGVFRWFTDRARWVTPFLGRLDRDRGLADVCQTVAEGLDAQRPLNAAVAEAPQPHLNQVLALRVREWSAGLELGLSAGEAAEAARLPEMMSGMLGRDRDVPDLAATLHFLEQYYRSRFSRLQYLLRQSAVPLLALVGGACVVVVALSIFSPMISMIEHVSVIKIRP